MVSKRRPGRANGLLHRLPASPPPPRPLRRRLCEQRSGFSTTIFEPFVQGAAQSAAARPGTGIGLSLVRELVALHGGRITLDRSPDLTGARFTIDLPRRRGHDT